MSKYIRTLTIRYDLPISNKEIPLFRGAVLHSMGDKANLLYHNHTGEDTFRYSYPLVQYKRLNGNAAMVCVEEGADVIGQFFTESDGSLKIGEREAKCTVSKISPVRILIQTWQKPFKYHITRWLPLNAKNYRLYQNMDDEDEKRTFLEKILIGNLLSMLKGLDIQIEEELLLKITQISNPYIIYNKGVGMMAFNADFNCNLTIPNNLGVGKNASIGYGVVYRQREEKEQTEQEEIDQRKEDGSI